MDTFLFGLFTWLSTFFRSRYNLSLEIIVLRQQLGMLKRKTPRPRLRMRDRVFWFLLRRLIRDYIGYYHEDRIHGSLEKDSPTKRSVSYEPGQSARLVSFPRIGGLHHRYDWRQAA